MIRVYYLPVEKMDNTEIIKGIEHIHNGIIECTENPDVRKLIMEATADEDGALSALALEVREPAAEERRAIEDLPVPVPGRDLQAEIDELRARVDSVESYLGV